jgi:splicing factor 3B subunit 2
MDGIQTPSGLETPSGMTSVVSTVAGGLETPDFLELRKNAARAPSEATDTGPRSLYQVVPEKQTSVRGLMGSERGYDVGAVTNAQAAIPVLGDERGTKVRETIVIIDLFSLIVTQRKANGVDISIDASELEGMSEEELRRRYDQHARGSAGVPGANGREDFSDMIAKEMAKKKQKMDRERETRKEKDFKF